MIHVAICIPARDEADRLPRLFDALERLDPLPSGRIAICLLLDGCRDTSASLAQAYRSRARHDVRIGVAPAAGANAGRARRRAMALGMAALDAPDGLLLSTDADSEPAPTWLSAMASALAEADIVAGRIVRAGRRPCPLQDRTERYYDALVTLRRRLDPVPWEAAATHHHTGGANLGMRAAAYRAIGGFVAQPSGEDARLVDDAARAGLRVRRDAACVVTTSDRRHGRAAAGLSSTLRHLDGGNGAAVTVAHPADAAWQYRMQALARRAHAERRWHAVAGALSLAADHVAGVARDCPNGEAFAMRVVPEPPGGMRTVTLPEAEQALTLLLDRRQAA